MIPTTAAVAATTTSTAAVIITGVVVLKPVLLSQLALMVQPPLTACSSPPLPLIPLQTALGFSLEQ